MKSEIFWSKGQKANEIVHNHRSQVDIKNSKLAEETLM